MSVDLLVTLRAGAPTTALELAPLPRPEYRVALYVPGAVDPGLGVPFYTLSRDEALARVEGVIRALTGGPRPPVGARLVVTVAATAYPSAGAETVLDITLARRRTTITWVATGGAAT